MLGRKGKKNSKRLSSSLSSSAGSTGAGLTGFQVSTEEMSTWVPRKLANWLVSVGLGAYAKDFEDNEIDGAAFLELTAEDLKTMGVKKLGHVKKILRLAKGIFDSESSASVSHSNLEDSASLSSSFIRGRDALSASSETSANTVTLKVTHGDTTKRVKVNSSERLVEVKAELASRFKLKDGGKGYRIRYLDDDGDKVSVNTEEEWRDCVAGNPRTMRIYLTGKRSSSHSRHSHHSDGSESSETSSTSRRERKKKRQTIDAGLSKHFRMYESLMSPVIVIDEKGIILFMNKRVRKLTRYNNLVGKNVKILMPPEHAARHDGYLKKYLKTGESSVIGLGRNVVLMNKHGVFKPVHLSVTETSLKGKKLFVGVFGESKEEEVERPSMIAMVRDILDSLSNPAVAMTPNCEIQVFNKAAEELFEWSLVEVIGKNVTMLMPPQHAANHDNYVQRYLDSGEAHVLGSGRNVVVMKKSGEFAPAYLTLTERHDSKTHLFTAVFAPPHDDED